MLFAQVKQKQLSAFAFAQALALENMLPSVVLAAPRGGSMEVASFELGSNEMREWIAERASHKLYMVTAEPRLTEPAIPRRIIDVAAGGASPVITVGQTHIIAVAIPAARGPALDAFRPAPAIVLETPEGFAAAWRLHNPTAPAKARGLAGQLAAYLGGAPIDYFFPLPGCGGTQLLNYFEGQETLVTDLDAALADGRARDAAPVDCSSGPAVMLGERKGGGGQVSWAPFNASVPLLNFGILVTGDPGSGKTQTLNVLIDGVARMGLPVCIFDFKNDYSDRDFVQAIGLNVLDVRRKGLPFNPLMPTAGADGQAQPIEHIFTIAHALKRVFSLGDRQHAALRDAMKKAFEQRGVNPQAWVRADTCEAPNFDDVMAILARQKDPHTAGLLDRLAPLVELGLFPKGEAAPFEAMLDERVVLSLFALPADDIKAALAELIIIRLHGVLVNRPQPRKLTRLLVLDEAWRVASSKHLENLAREGRAFGAGIAIGTQYPGDLPADLSGALGTKIYLKNQQPDHKKAVVLALCGANTGPEAANLHGILEQLGQFEGMIQNQHYLPYAEFKLTPYFKRARQHAHRKAAEGAGAPWRAAWASSTPADVPPPAMAAPAPVEPQSKDRAGETAKKWLVDRLSDGEWHDSASIIGPAFQEKGITKPTLYRARDALGVVTRKQTDSDRHDWRLPKAGDSQ